MRSKTVSKGGKLFVKVQFSNEHIIRLLKKKKDFYLQALKYTKQTRRKNRLNNKIKVFGLVISRMEDFKEDFKTARDKVKEALYNE